MAQDTIVKGLSNLVSMEFAFTELVGLFAFNDIQLTIGDETYTTLINTAQLIAVSQTLLTLDIGTTTALAIGSYTPTIKGVIGTKTFELTGKCTPLLGSINVC
tara:strand:+ start:653 stop:961 length:309 start_codon:yes stop_codon:yes gene_type:complete